MARINHTTSEESNREISAGADLSKRREAGRRYAEAHREELRQKSRAYYVANKEKCSEYRRLYRAANREKCSQADRDYVETHREQVREKNRLCQVRKRRQEGIQPRSLSSYKIGDMVGPRKIIDGPQMMGGTSGKQYPCWLLQCVCGRTKWIRQSDLRARVGTSGCHGCCRRKHSSIKLGDEYGTRIVADGPRYIQCGHSASKFWLLRCKCQTETWVSDSEIRRRLRLGKTITCSSCVHMKPLDNADCKDLSDLRRSSVMRRYWTIVKRGAIARDLQVSVTAERAFGLLAEQHFKCALSGVTIRLALTTREEDLLQATASLDRIDSSKGYEEGNIQWIHKDLNWMKQALSQKTFIHWCTLVASYQTRHKVRSKTPPLLFPEMTGEDLSTAQ